MKIINIKTLRDDLVKTYESLGVEGGTSINTARTKSSVASNIINSLRVELAERIRIKKHGVIDFLNCDYQGD